MTNHVHLLLTPEFAETPSMVLQSVGRQYVRYVNQVYRRSGTLWEGRYKSTLIYSDRYLLTCSRYIELNPVRARMAEHPGDYRWSSYICNTSGETGAIISPHPIYLTMGNSPSVRGLAYRALFERYIDSHDLLEIRQATEAGTVLGNDRFIGQVENILRRRVDRQSHGGNRKSEPFQEGKKESVE